MEFDPADQLYALEQARTDLAEAEQEIVKMKADREVQIAQDAVELLTARFDVRRAELDAQGNEFVSPIDAQKNVLSLEEAKRRLAQLEEDVKSRSVTSQASMQVVEEKRNKARDGDAAGAAGDRQPGAEGAGRRRRLGQGEPRCLRRHVLLRHGAAGIPRRGFGLAGTAGARRDRGGPDGAAGEDRRERPQQPGRGADGRRLGRHAAGADVQGQGRGALRSCDPRRLLRADRERVAAVRRHVPVRDA